MNLWANDDDHKNFGLLGERWRPWHCCRGVTRYCVRDVGRARGGGAAVLRTGRPDQPGFPIASLHPDIEWVPVQSDPEYSVHRGHDDVRAWLTSWVESFPDLRWALDRVRDAE